MACSRESTIPQDLRGIDACRASYRPAENHFREGAKEPPLEATDNTNTNTNNNNAHRFIQQFCSEWIWPRTQPRAISVTSVSSVVNDPLESWMGPC